MVILSKTRMNIRVYEHNERWARETAFTIMVMIVFANRRCALKTKDNDMPILVMKISHRRGTAVSKIETKQMMVMILKNDMQ